MMVFADPKDFKKGHKAGFKSSNDLHPMSVLYECKCLYNNVIVGKKPVTALDEFVP